MDYVLRIASFVDCVNPTLLAETFTQRARVGRKPAAVVLVHLYGQSADIEPILAACERIEVPLVDAERAAEALGASFDRLRNRGRTPGTFGKVGIFYPKGTLSFNGNKIITTSGGGMLVSDAKRGELIAHARKLATQARDKAPHYQHSEIGYNYRLSNVLAAIGRGQLEVLEERVQARRRNFDYYQETLGHLPGIEFMPEAPWGRHSRWLTTLTIDAEAFGADREAVRLALAEENIDARPVWKPMHLQPVFAEYEAVGGEVAEDLFRRGLCLPSGSNLTQEELARVVGVIRSLCYGGNSL